MRGANEFWAQVLGVEWALAISHFLRLAAAIAPQALKRKADL